MKSGGQWCRWAVDEIAKRVDGGYLTVQDLLNLEEALSGLMDKVLAKQQEETSPEYARFKKAFEG